MGRSEVTLILYYLIGRGCSQIVLSLVALEGGLREFSRFYRSFVANSCLLQADDRVLNVYPNLVYLLL